MRDSGSIMIRQVEALGIRLTATDTLETSLKVSMMEMAPYITPAAADMKDVLRTI